MKKKASLARKDPAPTTAAPPHRVQLATAAAAASSAAAPSDPADAVWALLHQGKFELAWSALARLQCEGLQSPGLLHAAGLRALQAGQHRAACADLAACVELAPTRAEAHYHLGRALRADGQFDRAITHYRRATMLDPVFGDAFSSLGIALRQIGRLREALEAQRKAAALRPQSAEIQVNLGNVLVSLQDVQGALAAYRKALAIRPGHAGATRGALICEGYALLAESRHAEARAAFDAALQRYPTDAPLFIGLGVARTCLEDPDGAAAAFAECLRLRPETESANCTDIANLLSGRRRWREAISWREQALAQRPEDSELLSNLGGSLISAGRHDEARTVLERALAVAPEDVGARYNLALLQLWDGDYRAGFEGYELRFAADVLEFPRVGDGSAPRWLGESIGERRLLVCQEQGLGDAIQFCRYLPALSEKLGRPPELLVNAALVDLLRASFPQVTIHPDSAAEHLAPDCVVALLSLPRRLSLEAQPSPVATPYLRASHDARARAARLRAGDRSPLLVGLAWRGNPRHDHDSDRSLPLDALRSLANPGVRFIALQKDATLAELAAAPELRLHPDAAGFASLDDTAAVIAQLDLVISVDSAVAHLAAALGVRTWMLSRWLGEWRWGRDGSATPWYPAMRIFRQSQPKEWRPVLAELSCALAGLAASQRLRSVD